MIFSLGLAALRGLVSAVWLTCAFLIDLIFYFPLISDASFFAMNKTVVTVSSWLFVTRSSSLLKVSVDSGRIEAEARLL